MTKNVALKKCDEYDFGQVYAAIKNLLELVPPPPVKGKVVLLKPNILYAKSPDLAVCTHPVVVGAAVKAFVEMGAAKVLVGESPATANPTSAAKATGMYKLIIDNGGIWREFKETTTVHCPEAISTKNFEVTNVIEEADIIVSLSKLKSHQLMTYTGAMKNLFGLMIGLHKAQQHYRFDTAETFGQFITDINVAVKPSYAIMDAIVGMDGPGGPGSGDPIKLGFLAASDNILALDWECSSLVGYNPYKVPNLADAMRRGIWLNNEDEINVLGDSEESCRSKKFRIVRKSAGDLAHMLPGWLQFLAKKVFTKTPHFSPAKCKKCHRCEQICPAHLISMSGKNGTAHLDKPNECLHCFCCHEICPAGAIKLKRF